MFLFFSVARSAQNDQAERAETVKTGKHGANTNVATVTDKLVDISPQALCMSSPFNAGYWLSVA